MRYTAVFDLDGVLFDVSERLMKCLEEVGSRSTEGVPRERLNAFWNCFLGTKYMHLDRPNAEAIEYIRRLRDGGARIVIVTGRREDTQREYTLKQLAEVGVEFDEIYFRPADCFKKDHEFKVEVVKSLLERGYEIAEVWDDSEAVVNALRRLLPTAKVILYKAGERR